MILGSALALACALVTNTGFLLRYRGAIAAAPVDGRHPLRSARALFASRWWTVGWLAAVVAWLLHVGALSVLPLSVVQAVLSGGLVFLAVLAERFFGFHLGRRQWAGLAITAAGLAVLAVTGGHAGGGGRSSLAGLIAVEAVVFAASSLLVIGAHKLDRLRQTDGMVLGVAAGSLFGVSDIAIKFLTHAARSGALAALVSPWTLAALAASLISFYASARSLQIGPALAVIAFTSVAANLVAIGGGILVFHDSIGAGTLEIVGRMLAFLFVIAGAALMPAPTRTRDQVSGAAPGLDAHPAVAQQPDAAQSDSEPLVPLLRGVSHAIAFVLSVGATVVVLGLAPTARATVALAVYGGGLIALFGGSALYHRWPGPARFKSLLRRIDHSMIFVFIAATYTPIALFVLHGALASVVLGAAWAGAAAGVVFSLGWTGASRRVVTGSYLALGWIAAIAIPQLLRELGTAPLVLLAAGCVLYTAGAIVYVKRRPDPWPRTFGFHELFHVLVIAAATAQYVAIIGWVLPASR